jgi:hypothetical protein
MIGLGLVAVGWTVDWKRISVDELQGTLNDQVGYISVARHLADGRGLESSLLYPSLLRQAVRKNTLYMPGFYWALSIPYRWFGYSVTASFVPAIAGYVLACGLTFWIAWKIYGEGVAVWACALVAFFPLSLVFAFSAMAETAVVAAGLVGFGVFVWGMDRAPGKSPFLRAERDERKVGVEFDQELRGADGEASHPSHGTGRMGHSAVTLAAPSGPIRWTALVLGAIALTMPLLFRETAVIVGVMMLAMVMQAARERWLRAGLMLAALMLAVVGLVMRSPVATGRPSLWKANILAGGDPKVLYADAFAVEELPSSVRDWADALGGNFMDNLRNLVWTSQDADGWAEEFSVWFLVGGIPLGAWLGWRGRDAFAGGVAVAVTVLLVADLSCYDIWGYHGARALLVLLPFVAMLWGRVAVSALARRGSWARSVAVMTCGAVGIAGAVQLIRAQAEVNAGAIQDRAFVTALAPDVGRMLVSPYDISMGFVNEHYPMQWAFLPSDCRTMRLLDARHAIGTLVVPVSEGTPSDLLQGCGLPLRLDGVREYRGGPYRVFRGGD